jgi:hypothetical protein
LYAGYCIRLPTILKPGIHLQDKNINAPVSKFIIPRVNVTLVAIIGSNMFIMFHPLLHNNLAPHSGVKRAVIFKGTTLGKSVAEGIVTG